MSRLSARRLAFEAYQRAAASKSSTTQRPAHLPAKPANPFVIPSGSKPSVGVSAEGESGTGGDEGEEEEAPPSWTAADARLLEEEVEKAKRGLLFLGIKDAK